MYSVEIERALLGHVVSDANAFDEVAEYIKGDWIFYKGEHRKVWQAVVTRLGKGESVDPLSIKEVTGLDILSMVEESRNVGVESAAKILVEKWLKRQLSDLSGVVKSGLNGDVYELIDTIHTRLYSTERALDVNATLDVGVHAERAYERMVAVRVGGTGLLGITTGFGDLDRLTAGLEGGKVYVLAGRPSQGKTAYALDIAKKTAQSGNAVGFFSLEMGAQQLAQRLISNVGKFDGQKARIGALSEGEMKLAENAMRKIKELPIYIDDSSALTPIKMRAVARRWIREKKVKLLVVDYVQLMSSGLKFTGREEEMASISKALKALAKDLNVPILALAQLNRTVEGTADHIPRLHHLRESGQIEQDADLVMFVHRPEKYGIEVTETGESTENLAEIRIEKQRDGPLGIVKLLFLKDQGSFASFHYVEHNAVAAEEIGSDAPPW